VITAILTAVGAGSAGGAIFAGVELFLKFRKAKKTLSIIRELASVIETDYENLSDEGQDRADETLARANILEGYP